MNLGGRRLGLAPGTEDERDLEQVREAIDAVRALLPIVERERGREPGARRDALAQLQMAYAQRLGRSAARGEPAPSEPGAEAPQSRAARGPAAVVSGRLWVPGELARTTSAPRFEDCARSARSAERSTRVGTGTCAPPGGARFT